MKYRPGIKYQLVEPFDVETGIVGMACRIAIPGLVEPLVLTTSGLLRIPAGYAWDGASGPTVDTEDSQTPSLVHDALYMLMRAGHLSTDARPAVDELLRRMCVERGMSHERARLWFDGVRTFAAGAADPDAPAFVVREAP